MTEAFTHRGGVLFAEDVAVGELAERHGTPLYVYSRGHLRARFRELTGAMAPVRPLICYSVKANSNAAVIRTFLEDGAGLDIVSGGELFRALRAGADPAKIVFAGVGKTREEIEYALRENILFFTVESEPEAARISECAQRLGTQGRIAFRVNPDVDPKTHKYISTGKKENKFGLDLERTRRAYATAARLPGVEIVGLHMHIGSQILQAQPFADALGKVSDLCRSFKQTYPSFRYLDIGGGIGIRYKPDQDPLAPDAFARAVMPTLESLGLSVVMEPGRCLVGNAGILVCRVQYVKEHRLKTFVVTDAAMNDLIRPSLYQAHHEIVAVNGRDGTIHGDLVGPVCESGDFLAAERDLPNVREGDLLAVMSVGAYGFAMASNYNSRRRPAEVMVDGGRSFVIRERETWEDLARGERVAG
jgi:diaminopimelate decarboxylase